MPPRVGVKPTPSSHIHPRKGLYAIDETNQACSVTYQYGQDHYLAFGAQSTRTKFDLCSHNLASIGALIGFYHACLGFPVKQTWLDAIKASNCDTFDGRLVVILAGALFYGTVTFENSTSV